MATVRWMDGCRRLVEVEIPGAEDVRTERDPVRTMNDRDADRLELLDRLADRVPDLDLDKRQIEWQTLPDGAEALLVDGGGLDGGDGIYFANHGDNVHAVGSLAPLAPGAIGCIVIRPDRSRHLAGVQPDPLAQQPD